ncbi:M60 family peptidase N-terminal accessory domain-containing protein, partial [Pontiella sp.]|uniref:M60 family peptidase N-terminal accessory domain-containing protein n=1 Tax=Pontiella sp. TaxID=2837462 RepID=UPI0035690BED
MKNHGKKRAPSAKDFAKRSMTALSLLLAWMAPAAPADTESDVVAALTELKSHVLGLETLGGSEISTRKATIVSGSTLFSYSTNAISAAFELVNAYDNEVGALWADGSPIQSFDRNTVTDEEIGWVVYTVMQTLMDETYTADNVAANAALLAGKRFGSSAHFPGAVAAPALATNSAILNASYPDTAGWPRSGDTSAARKPTGNYVAPGTIVTLKVPPAIVDKGYQIRVGAHSWDLETRKTTVKRLDRSSIVYDIDRTEIQVGSPLGGGIYLEVPYLADAGVVEIELTGAVRSPYYSSNTVTGHITSLSEWQETERNHPAPWADFQTEKFMMQVPTDWIYNWDDP